MTTVDRKALLKTMRICRFCLTDQEPLTSIYDHDNRLEEDTIPLPLQILTCVSIEVFASDEMPQLICNICCLQASRAYKFKTHCKKSDDALKLFLATGNLLKPTKTISEVLELKSSGGMKSKCKEKEIPPAKRATLNGKNDYVITHIDDEIGHNKPKSSSSLQHAQEVVIIEEEFIEGVEDEEDNSEDNQVLLYEELEDTPKDPCDEDSIEKLTPTNVPVDVYPCTVCDRTFALQQLLDIHLTNHERERKFRCPKCEKLFFSKSDLTKHSKVHTGEKPFQCVVCMKTFARATLMHRHEKIHLPKLKSSGGMKSKCKEKEIPPAKRAKLNGKNDYVITHIDDEIGHIKPKSSSSLQHAQEVVIIEEEYIEGAEDEEDNSEDNQVLLNEELEDTPKDPCDEDSIEKLTPTNVPVDVYPCTVCDRTFALQQLLDIHLTNHERERKFRCPKCKKLFLSKCDLTKHSKVHTGEKPFQCVVCMKTFVGTASLHRHETIHVEVPKYLCTTCDRTFLAKELLDRHETVHKKNRPFPCDKCDKSFVFKHGLDRHAKNHRTDKPHKCNYCMLSFNTPARLARHITSHAGMRRFPCDVCPRTFLLSHHLKRHKLDLHANPNETFKCTECAMEFKCKDGVIGHSTVHSMVSLRCLFCSKQFGDLKLVVEHVKTHMYSRIFPCGKCNYSFITKKHLKNHEVAHYKTNVWTSGTTVVAKLKNR